MYCMPSYSLPHFLYSSLVDSSHRAGDRQTFQLSRYITIPTFTGHGGEVHIGKVVTAGHCPTFYFPDDNEDLWCNHLLHDDDQIAAPGTYASKQAILTNGCLLAFVGLSTPNIMR